MTIYSNMMMNRVSFAARSFAVIGLSLSVMQVLGCDLGDKNVGYEEGAEDESGESEEESEDESGEESEDESGGSESTDESAGEESFGEESFGDDSDETESSDGGDTTGEDTGGPGFPPVECGEMTCELGLICVHEGIDCVLGELFQADPACMAIPAGCDEDDEFFYICVAGLCEVKNGNYEEGSLYCNIIVDECW